MPYVPKAKREAIDALLRAGFKLCCRCHEQKSVAEFSRQLKDKTGLRPECKACYNVLERSRYLRDRDSIRTRQREQNKTEHRRTWNRNYQRERHRREREILADRSRPSACEVCGSVGPVYYDHDHQTGKRIGKFRGWLCRDCNTAIGYVHDDSAVLRRLADYLDCYAVKLERIA